MAQSDCDCCVFDFVSAKRPDIVASVLLQLLDNLLAEMSTPEIGATRTATVLTVGLQIIPFSCSSRYCSFQPTRLRLLSAVFSIVCSQKP